MNNDKAIFEDWEMEKLNELVKYTSEKNLKEKALKEGHKQGLKEGIEQGIEQTIKNMLNEGLDIALISKITGKTEEEIIKFKETLK